jgi:CRP/FNR family transcriptional regulator, cyclic AMP receptor protein
VPIFRVGDPGEFLCVLLSGTVEIRKNDKLITVVTPGDMFGEMGLIDNQPRSADAVAISHTRIALIREGQFMSLLEATPYFALAIMRLLTERFRRRTET